MRASVTILFLFALLNSSCCTGNADYLDWYNQTDSLDQQQKPLVPKLEDNQIKVMSFNVRYINEEDTGTTAWDYRKQAIPLMVADHNPTVMGTQELRPVQRTWLDSLLTEYSSIGQDYTVIYYRTADLELINNGTFWLSETPDIKSKGWDANNIRTANWAVFRHKAYDRLFFYLNTHLDHIGVVAPYESMALIIDRLKTLNPENYPMVVTADFNKRIDSDIFDRFKTTMTDVRTAAPFTDNIATYQAFGAKTGSIVDHIFCRDFSVARYATVDTKYGDVPYISDHYPIYGILEFK